MWRDPLRENLGQAQGTWPLPDAFQSFANRPGHAYRVIVCSTIGGSRAMENSLAAMLVDTL